MKISEKYLAGFLDADGHFSVRARKGARPDLVVSAAQRCYWSEPLVAMQEMFGGQIREKHDGKHLELVMSCGPARKAIERLKKYLVIKKHHAELFLELVDSSFVLHTDDDVAKVRKRVKEIRGYGATNEPNFPARKWLAGYIDGDGSINVKVCKKTNYAYPSLSIMAAPNYIVGLTLIQKVFGGQLCSVGNNALWQLQLSQPSKIKEMLGYFAKDSIIKRNQLKFLLGCADGGNLRDGETIRKTIKSLNAQQHRLSDSSVNELIDSINFNIPKRRAGRPIGVKELVPRRKRQSKL